MNILQYALSSSIFSIDIGMFLLNFSFFMIGFLFLTVFYLILKLWISDIILKFLIERFTKDIVDMKGYPKKEKNEINRYISIGLIIAFIAPPIISDFLFSTNDAIYFIQACIVFVFTVLIYRKIKKMVK